jgi:hypothetical protein
VRIQWPDLDHIVLVLIRRCYSHSQVSWIRRNYELFSSSNGILYDVQVAMDVITPEDAEGYFFHAGYF